MGYRYLSISRDGPIERVVLNRPEVRNAFNEHVISELTHWANACSKAPVGARPRVVVLSGAGPMFSAGADVAWMAKQIEYSEEENVRDAAEASQMFQALDALPVPLVGRIHGAALGGGCGLAAVCDIVVADENAIFGFTEVKLGILPAVISPFALAKIGRSAARELFLTGARFSAVRAKEIGLIHAVVPFAELDDAVDRFTSELLSAGPEAIGAAKALIAEVWGQPISSAAPLTARAIAARRVSQEGQDGLRAFLEKRKPGWLGTKSDTTEDAVGTPGRGGQNRKKQTP